MIQHEVRYATKFVYDLYAGRVSCVVYGVARWMFVLRSPSGGHSLCSVGAFSFECGKRVELRLVTSYVCA